MYASHKHIKLRPNSLLRENDTVIESDSTVLRNEVARKRDESDRSNQAINLCMRSIQIFQLFDKASFTLLQYDSDC